MLNLIYYFQKGDFFILNFMRAVHFNAGWREFKDRDVIFFFGKIMWKVCFYAQCFVSFNPIYSCLILF